MPDLVNDPRFYGVNQPSMDNPLHDDDTSNDYMFDEWKANADLWREWAALQDDAIGRYVRDNTDETTDADAALRKAGFVNAKEQGKHAFTMYGNGGYFGQMGAAADPGWEYNWSTGKKRNIGTADKTARDRWVPINSEEYRERQKAQTYSQQGITDYGRQSAAEAFKVAVANGHFNYDPVSGTWFSGMSPTDPNGHTARGWGMTPGNMGVNLNRVGKIPGQQQQQAPAKPSYGVGPDEYRPYLKGAGSANTGVWGRPNATPVFGSPTSNAAPKSDPIKLPNSNPASSSFPQIAGLTPTKKKEFGDDYGALSGGESASGY